MSKLDDLDRAREEMKDALRKARYEVESNRTIVPNDFSRVELIAYNRWVTKMELEKKDINNITEGDRAEYFDLLEKVKLQFVKFW